MDKQKLPLSLGQAGSVVPKASARLFVVSTIVRKGRGVARLLLCEPYGEVLNWRVLRIPALKEEGSVADNQGLENNEECSKV